MARAQQAQEVAPDLHPAPVEETMTYILRERCVGTGALSYHVCGARRLASYIGNKLKYAAQLVEIMQIKGPPQRLIWWDTGEWANTLATLHVYGKWREVAQVIDLWGAERKAAYDAGIDVRGGVDDRDLYDMLLGCDVPTDMVTRAAAHLYLQTRTFNGKPVKVIDGTRWRTAGFAPEYSVSVGNLRSKNSHARGWATPRWKLADNVRAAGAVDWPPVTIAPQPGLLEPGRVIDYFDPPPPTRASRATATPTPVRSLLQTPWPPTMLALTST